METVFLKSAFQENHYPQPDKPEIAFAGRSNVGKSSLINVLVNRKKLVKISSRPGRTQAINFFSINNDLYFVDLPGYGYARVPLQVKKSWGKMVETYLRKRNNLKAVVVIIDIRRGPNDSDMDLLNWLRLYGKGSIIVLTKADKLSRQKSVSSAKSIGNRLKEVTAEAPIIFSAKTKQGKKNLWEKINRLVNREHPVNSTIG